MAILRFGILFAVLALCSLHSCQAGEEEDKKASKSVGISKRDEDLRTYESHQRAVTKGERRSKSDQGEGVKKSRDKRGHHFESDLTDDYEERLRARQQMREEIEDAVERELEQNEAADALLKERQLRVGGVGAASIGKSESKREKIMAEEQIVSEKREGKGQNAVNREQHASLSDLARKEIKYEKKEKKESTESESKVDKAKTESRKTVEKRKERKWSEERREKSQEETRTSKCSMTYEEKKEQPAEEELNLPRKRNQAEEEDQQEQKRNRKYEISDKKSMQAREHLVRNGRLRDNAKRTQVKIKENHKEHGEAILDEERAKKVSRFPWHDLAKRGKKMRNHGMGQLAMKHEEEWKKGDKRMLQHKNKENSAKKTKPASKYSRFVKKNIARTNEDMFRPHDRP